MIRREEARLRRFFRRVLAVAAAAPLPLALEHCQTVNAVPIDDAADADADAADERPAFDDPTSRFDAADPCSPHPYTPPPGVDAGDNCADFVALRCGLPSGIVPRNCYFSLQDCSDLCGPFLFECHAFGDSCVDGGGSGDYVNADAEVIVDCNRCSTGSGRRPRGLEMPPETPRATPRSLGSAGAASALGAYWASVAHLEAASVVAFRILGAELTALGAPSSLVRAAARSMREEASHARVTRRLARLHGAVAPRVRMRRRDRHRDRGGPGDRRSLEALAAENAVEGCVRETYGALVATWQAAHARDPEIAKAMDRIAKDETRHAALAWAIARWAEARLDRKARARVAARARAAVADLAKEIGAGKTPAVLLTLAGMPPEAARRTMVEELARDLWSVAAS